MKKTVSLVVFLMMMVLLAACGTASPQAAVDGYLEAMKNGDEDLAADYLDYDSTLIDVFEYKYLKTIHEDNDVKEYTLLYDCKIANGLGNELHKKIEFDVEYDSSRKVDGKDSPGYVITSFTIRGGDDTDSDF